MSKLLSFLAGVFKDVNGSPSSKRVIAFVLLALMCAITVGVTWFGAHFEATIWGDLNWGLLLFGGMVTSEILFANKKS
jgi:hypothetical protein